MRKRDRAEALLQRQERVLHRGLLQLGAILVYALEKPAERMDRLKDPDMQRVSGIVHHLMLELPKEDVPTDTQMAWQKRELFFR